MPIFLPRPRVSKSQLGVPLDPTHPLAHRLRLFLPFNEAGGGKLTNLLRADQTFSVNNPGGWKPFAGDASRADLGLKFNGTSDFGLSDKTFTGWTGDLTVAVLLHQSVVPSVTQVVAELSSNVNSVNDAWAIFLDGPPWSVVGLRRSNAGTYSSAEVAVTAPGLHLYTFVHKAGSTALGWQDGVIPHATGISSTAHPGTWGDYTLNIGARAGSSLFFREGLLGLWVWARGLSQTEIIQHAAEPFGMLAQRRLWILDEGATGGASHPLAATVASAATLTVAAFAPLNAAIAAVATVSAAAPGPLNAAIAAVATVTALAPAPLNAAISATATVTATRLNLSHALAASVASTATMTAAAPTPLNASISAAASLTASAPAPLNASIAATATATAITFTPINAAISAQATVGAKAFAPLNATIASQATVTATFAGDGAVLSAQIAAVATFTAAAFAALNASLAAQSSLTAQVFAPLNAAISAGSTVTASRLSEDHALSAQIAATATFAAVALSVDGGVVASFVFAAPTRTATLTTPTRSLTLTGPSALRILTTPSGVRGDDV